MTVSNQIRVLYFIDYFHRTGGTERHLAHLVQLLPEETFRCGIVAFDLGGNALLDAVRARGIPVIHIPVGREYDWNGLKRAWQLWKLMREMKIDIVQTFHQKSDTYAAVIARLAGVKHIISSKRDTGDLRKPLDIFFNRRLKGLFERVIVVAEAVGKAVIANDGIDPARIVRIYNGVDADAFRPPTREQIVKAREQLGFTPEDFVVGTVAGFRPEKNYDVFFDGVQLAMRQIPRMKILAIGGGPLLEQFKERCARQGLAECVTFTGAIHDVHRYMHAMDVGCLVPGSNEGFSNAVLEKMAMGLPLIVTDIGGNAEAVIDQDNGFVIPPNDVAAFADALVRMHADRARTERMGKRSRELVEEKFSLEAMWKTHQALYLSLCHRPDSRRADST